MSIWANMKVGEYFMFKKVYGDFGVGLYVEGY